MYYGDTPTQTTTNTITRGAYQVYGVVARSNAVDDWTSGNNDYYTNIKGAAERESSGAIKLAGTAIYEPGIALDDNETITIQGAGVGTTYVQADATAGTASDRIFNITSGTLTLQDMTIRYGNSAGGSGGGISIIFGATHTVNINNVNVSENSADAGGGIYIAPTATGTQVNITNSTINGNTATGAVGGGGVFSNDSGGDMIYLNIINSTISGNSASHSSSKGGGIHNYYLSITNLKNSTIAGNSAGSSGGGVYFDGDTLNIRNSILANNTASASPDDYYYVSGRLNDYGYNVVEYQNLSSSAANDDKAFNDTTDILYNTIVGTDTIGYGHWNQNASDFDGSLNLSTTLALNGSLNGTYTLALGEGSFAAGSESGNGIPPAGSWNGSPADDQRGVARFANQNTSIGAYSENYILPNVTWTGSEDSYWTNGNNWSGGSPPGGEDDVIIPDAGTTDNDPDVAGQYSIQSLTVQDGGVVNFVAEISQITAASGVISVTGTGGGSGALVASGSNGISLLAQGDNITLAGAQITSASGPVTISSTGGTVQVTGTTSITSTSGAVTFNSDGGDMGGGGTLAIDGGTGTVDIQDAIDNLAAFTVSAANTANLRDVTTTGAVTITAATIDLDGGITAPGANVTLNATTEVSLAENKDINTTAAANSGTVSGAVDVNVSGSGTVNLLGNIVTAGANTDTASGGPHGSPGGNITIDTEGQAIAVASLDSSGGEFTGSGAYNGGAGGSITLNGNGGSVTVTGTLASNGGQCFSATGARNGGAGGAVTLTGSDVAIESSMNSKGGDGEGGYSAGSGGNITIDATDVTPLITIGGDIQTWSGYGNNGRGGDITFNDNVTLTTDITLTTGTTDAARKGGNVTFSGTITGTSADNLTVDTGTTLFAGTATAWFKNSVGAGGQIANLEITAGTNIKLDNSITTSGTQDYNSKVTIEDHVSFTAADNHVTFDSTISGTSSDNLTVDAGTGTVTFGGAVGAGSQINDVDIDAGTLTQNAAITGQGNVDINTTGSLTIGQNLTSGGSTDITVSTDNNTFTHSGGTLSSASGTLTVSADDMSLDATISASGQIVNLRSHTASDPWDLGSNPGTANTLELTEAELETINTGSDGVLRIGTTTAASGVISAAIDDLTNVNDIALAAAGITQSHPFVFSGLLTVQTIAGFDTNGNDITTSGFTLNGGTFNSDSEGGTWDINGDMALNGGTFNATSGSLNFSGGTFDIDGGTFVANNGTFVFDRGAVQTVQSGEVTFNNLQLTESTVLTTSQDITLGGTTSGTGTVNASAGTFNYSRNGDQSVFSGTYNNLYKSHPTTACTLTFQAGSTTTVTGTLTLQGQADKLLSLRSTASGTQWNINPTGRTVEYLDVKDSNNTHVTAIDAGETSKTAGNNTNWTFPSAPTVTTQAVSDIAITTATGNGNVTDLGAGGITQHGVCWGTSENPTTANDCTTDGEVSATGDFTSSMTGLADDTDYHARAYATNTYGTSYGGQVDFSTFSEGVISTEAGGNWSEGSTWEEGQVPVSIQNVTINGPVSVNTDAEVENLTVNAGKELTVGDGNTLTVNGTLAAAGSTITFTGAGTLDLSGTVACTAFGTVNCGTGTVIYSAYENQNVDNLTYYNLTLGGTGTWTKTLCGEVTVENTLTTAVDTTLALGANTLNIGSAGAGTGSWSNNGTFQNEGGTVNYGKTGDQNILNLDYDGLNLAGSGTKTFFGTTTVSGGVGITGPVTAAGSTPTASDTVVQTHASPDSGSHRVFTVSTDDLTVTLQNMTIRNGVDDNSSGFHGGAGILVYADNVTLTLDNIDLYNNVVTTDQSTSNEPYGAGLLVEGVDFDVTIQNSVIHHNTNNSDMGGGIAFARTSGADPDACRFSISNTAIYSNSIANYSAGYGGGIYTEYLNSSATSTITDCVIYDNSATHTGGGISMYDTKLTMIDTTLSGNTSDNYAGGMRTKESSIMLNSVTIANNHSDNDNTGGEDGGGYYLTTGTLAIKNSIIANNYRGSETLVTDDFYLGGGTLTDNGYNAIGVNNNSAGWSGTGTWLYNFGTGTFVQNGTGYTGTLQLSNSLADNGGPTQTLALTDPSSIANGTIPYLAGTNTFNGSPDRDQRGYLRAFSGSRDIGAYEYDATAPSNGDYLSVADGNWSAAATTWEHYNSTTKLWNAVSTEPGGGNNAVIAANDTVTVDGADSINALTISRGGTLTVGDNSLTANGAVDMNGTLGISDGTFDADAAFDATGGNVTFSGSGGELQLGSTVTSLGTLTPAEGTVTYNGEDQTVDANTYYNATMAGSGTKTLPESVTVNNTLTIDDGVTLYVNGSDPVTVQSLTVNSGGTMDVSDFTANLRIGGDLLIEASGVWFKHVDSDYCVQFTGAACTFEDLSAGQNLGHVKVDD